MDKHINAQVAFICFDRAKEADFHGALLPVETSMVAQNMGARHACAI